jgi:uncharacterized protein YdcH (DUF465 family)
MIALYKMHRKIEMNYFIGCNNAQEAKKIYHELAMQFHPDVGGTNDKMIELKRQYDAWIPVEPIKPVKTSPFMHSMNNASGFQGFQAFNYYNQHGRDQPLQEEINKLRETIKIKDKIIEELANERMYYSCEVNRLFHVNSNFHEKLEELQENIKNLKKELIQIKDKEPKSLWQYLTGKL